MSEQRRIRAELKTGLHQFTMSMYRSYSQAMNHDEAVNLIGEIIMEEYEYLTKRSAPAQSNDHSMEEFMKHIETLARKEPDHYKQVQMYEDLEKLSSVPEILGRYKLEDN